MNESMDEGYRRVAAFAVRLREFSADDWAQLTVRCAHLDGSSFIALVARARLSGEPYVLGKSGHDATDLAFNLALELVGEFQSIRDRGLQIAGMRAGVTRSAHSPELKAAMNAHLALEEAILPLEPDHPGVATALRAVARALVLHKFLTPERFASIYSFVEPQIPLSAIIPSADDAA
jgi:hypothetical protein